MPIERYRPSLTAEQIRTICAALKQAPFSESIQDCLASLVPFLAKIENSIKKPVSSVETLSEKLGWESTTAQSPEEKRAAAYAKWLSSSESCNLSELQLANDYRYTNGLMSEEEKAKYEAALFAGK